MFWVTRKLTGKVVGRKIPEDTLEVYLSTLPTGVYAVEDSDGNELNEVAVKKGRVEFKHCYGPVPEDTVVSTGAVVSFMPEVQVAPVVPVAAFSRFFSI